MIVKSAGQEWSALFLWEPTVAPLTLGLARLDTRAPSLFSLGLGPARPKPRFSCFLTFALSSPVHLPAPSRLQYYVSPLGQFRQKGFA